MQQERFRNLILALFLAELMVLTGCMMVRGESRIQPCSDGTGEMSTGSARVPVALALSTQVFLDGLHLRSEEYNEHGILAGLILKELGRSGILSEQLRQPSPEALNLMVEILEERSGPVGLRVLSSVTFRLFPSWMRVKYRLCATGFFRGRQIVPFQYETRGTEVEHLLLLPVAPFLSPDSGRRKIRDEAVKALARHLAGVVAKAGSEMKGEHP